MTAWLCVPRTSASTIYPLSIPPLLACLSSTSQDVVDQLHLIGSPGTGKVRGQPLSVLYPCHLSVHDMTSYLHALPRAAVL